MTGAVRSGGSAAAPRKSRFVASYVIGLALLVAVSAFSHVAILDTLKREDEGARIVNLSGAQRMLSQRVLALSQSLSAPQTRTEARMERLEQSISAIRTAHAELQAYALGHEMSAGLERELAAVFGGADGVDALMRDYTALAETALSRPLTPDELAGLEAMAYGALFDRLDRAVGLFQADVEEGIGAVSNAHLIMILVMAGVVLAEAAFIFWPLTRRLMSALRAEHRARALGDEVLSIVTTPDPDHARRIERMLATAAHHFGAENAMLYVERPGETARLYAAAPQAGRDMDAAQAVTRHVRALQTGAGGVVSHERPAGAGTAAIGGAPQIAALIAAPIALEGGASGALAFHSNRPRAERFNGQDHAFAERVATWCAQELSTRFTVEDLQADTERFGLAVAGAGVGIFDWTDLSQAGLYWSEHHYRLLGHAPDAFAPSTADYMEMVHQDDRSRIEAAVRDHLKSRRSFSEEARLRLRSGDYRWFMVTGQAVWNEAGRPVRMIGSIADIDDRKRGETYKAEFMSTISHELRTPLTSLTGVLRLFQTGRFGALNDSGRRMLGIAMSSGERLIRLLNDLLDVEKIEAGEMKIEPAPHRAGALLRRAVDESFPAEQATKIRFDLIDETGDAVFEVDPDRFIQVIANLLSNAAKFTPPGGRITVEAGVESGELAIRVNDTGPGIPESQLGRIFSRFIQADGSDTRKVGGTGLGLAICRAIVTAHGGRISAANRPEGGACFDVRLPIAAPERSVKVA